MSEYELVVGLEVHAELNTQTKIFCGCSTAVGQAPNSQPCPVCLAHPGALPVVNRRAVEYAMRIALALDCTVQPRNVFHRKNYFYPDLPKGYQISQYELPVVQGGCIVIPTAAGEKAIRLTRAHLEGAPFHGWSTVAVLVEQCRAQAEAGAPLVYAYYPGVDTVAHEFGLHDDRYRAELGFADRLVGWLLDALPAYATLLVTADHGQAQVGPEGWVDLPTVAGLAPIQAGDGRFRHLHARPGGAADLLAAAREEVGERAWVFTRSELIEGGWLGPGRPTPAAGARLGDVVLAARDGWAFADPALRREADLVSAHGSLTEGEMLVPLLAGRGRG